MRRSLQRGEIATIVAIGTLVIIGVASLFSSAFLGQKQTTKSKAQETCKEEFFCIDKTCMKRFTDCSQNFAPDKCAGLPCGPQQQTNTSPAPIISLGAGSGTGRCNDDYREACTCTGGQSGTKACHKEGPLGTEGKTGVNCPWDSSVSKCGSCECSGGGGGATSPAPSKPPETGSGGGDCAWGDWTCAAAGGNNDAGRICGKMGKSLCAPGDGRSDGAGKVCQKNPWDDKWGCWGSGLSTTTSTPYGYCNLSEGSCSQRSQQDPKEHYLKWFKCSSGEWKGPFDSENICKGGTTSTSTSGGTNCTPGDGGPGPGNKYYCCFKSNEGPSLKLPFPHYEEQPAETKCDVATGTADVTTNKVCNNLKTQPTCDVQKFDPKCSWYDRCSKCALYGTQLELVCPLPADAPAYCPSDFNAQSCSPYIFEQNCPDNLPQACASRSKEDSKLKYCCPSSLPVAPATPSSFKCNKIDCSSPLTGSYWLRYAGTKALGYYNEESLCKDSTVSDSGVSSRDTVRTAKCSASASTTVTTLVETVRKGIVLTANTDNPSCYVNTDKGINCKRFCPINEIEIPGYICVQ